MSGIPQNISGGAIKLHMAKADSSSLPEAKLYASDGAELDHFGFSLAVDGDAAIAGAWGDGVNGVNSGSAYLFRGQIRLLSRA